MHRLASGSAGFAEAGADGDSISGLGMQNSCLSKSTAAARRLLRLRNRLDESNKLR